MQRDLEGGSVRGNAGFDQRIGQALLALYSPAVIVVARELEVLACRGDFARLFGADPPDASAEWLTSASTGAGAAVRRLVGLSARTAARQTEVVSLPDHPGRDAGRCVRITAVPDSGSPAGAVFVLVFESMEPPARAGHVENELSAARLYLQTVIDDYEANTEELRSAHEELQAANEELLKTNEELGTSQHELESLNRRLRDSNGELTRANRDLVTLLDSIELPVLMLDSDLRVRRFNASSRALFNVLPSDVGRPIADLRPKLPIPGLEAACREVLQDLAPWERQVRDGDGRVAVLSIRAYRGSGNLIEGVVLTLTPRRNVRNLSGAA